MPGISKRITAGQLIEFLKGCPADSDVLFEPQVNLTKYDRVLMDRIDWDAGSDNYVVILKGGRVHGPTA